MKVRVRYGYSSYPTSAISASTVDIFETTDKSHSALIAMIKAKYPSRHNIQIRSIEVL